MQTVKGESLDFSNMINKLENQLPSHITKKSTRAYTGTCYDQ